MRLFTEVKIYQSDGNLIRIERRSTSDNTMIVYYYIDKVNYCVVQFREIIKQFEYTNVDVKSHIRHGYTHFYAKMNPLYIQSSFYNMGNLEGEAINFK